MDRLTTATHDYKLAFWVNRIKEYRASGLCQLSGTWHAWHVTDTF